MRHTARFITALTLLLCLASTDVLAQQRPSRRTPVRPSVPSPGTPSTGEIPPPDPNQPRNVEAPDEPVSFNYDGVELINIIKSIGARTGKNFLVDPNIAQTKVTIISYSDVPAEYAYEMLEAVLASLGYALQPTVDDNLIRVVQVGGDVEKRTFHPSTDTGIPGFDTFGTYLIDVQYADATEMSQLLQKFGSKACDINVYAKTNTLIISDTADGVRNITRIIEQLDVPGQANVMEIFVLEFTRAETIAQQITEVLMPSGATPMPTPRTQRATPARPVRPTVPGQAGTVVAGASPDELRIVPDERLNALIVVATENLMGQVRNLVNSLDTATPVEQNNMHIYELLNADAEKVEEALNGILGIQPRAAGGGGGGNSPVNVSEVQPFEKKVVITRYERTNSLLIVAAPQDYKTLCEVIAQLDVPQRQVYVESMIMDVRITDEFTLQAETTALTNDNAFALNNVTRLATILSGAESTGSLFGGVLSGASGPGATFGVLGDDIDVSIGGDTVTIPSIPLLLYSLESLTDVDVLSQPSLTTQDNEEARIVVGEQVPFVSGSSSGLDQSSIGRTVYNQIKREEVGVKMTVTPQVNEGDYVALELNVEVSSTNVPQIGDPNILGPTIALSEIENNVVVKDGETGVIGGLISEGTNHNTNQTPVLGDVPVLGWLFRSKTSGRNKRNLVILVTPHIIKEGIDMERVTDYSMGEFKYGNADLLFQKGFIKKIKKKYKTRASYRPTEAHTERRAKESRFGRSKMDENE